MHETSVMVDNSCDDSTGTTVGPISTPASRAETRIPVSMRSSLRMTVFRFGAASPLPRVRLSREPTSAFTSRFGPRGEPGPRRHRPHEVERQLCEPRRCGTQPRCFCRLPAFQPGARKAASARFVGIAETENPQAAIAQRRSDAIQRDDPRSCITPTGSSRSKLGSATTGGRSTGQHRQRRRVQGELPIQILDPSPRQVRLPRSGRGAERLPVHDGASNKAKVIVYG